MKYLTQMSMQNRIIKALQDKFPGNKSKEGINFSHAGKAIGVSHQTIMKWVKEENIDLNTKNWLKLSNTTGYSRDWLQQGIGPEKLSDYNKLLKNKNNQRLIDMGNKLKLIKWEQLGSARLLSDIKEVRIMSMIGNNSTNAIAVEMESNQFLPYVGKGEIIVIEPDINSHGRHVLIQYDNEPYIIKQDKLTNLIFDVNGNEIKFNSNFKTLGVIVNIHNVREG